MGFEAPCGLLPADHSTPLRTCRLSRNRQPPPLPTTTAASPSPSSFHSDVEDPFHALCDPGPDADATSSQDAGRFAGLGGALSEDDEVHVRVAHHQPAEEEKARTAHEPGGCCCRPFGGGRCGRCGARACEAHASGRMDGVSLGGREVMGQPERCVRAFGARAASCGSRRGGTRPVSLVGADAGRFAGLGGALPDDDDDEVDATVLRHQMPDQLGHEPGERLAGRVGR